VLYDLFICIFVAVVVASSNVPSVERQVVCVCVCLSAKVWYGELFLWIPDKDKERSWIQAASVSGLQRHPAVAWGWRRKGVKRNVYMYNCYIHVCHRQDHFHKSSSTEQRVTFNNADTECGGNTMMVHSVTWYHLHPPHLWSFVLPCSSPFFRLVKGSVYWPTNSLLRRPVWSRTQKRMRQSSGTLMLKFMSASQWGLRAVTVTRTNLCKLLVFY